MATREPAANHRWIWVAIGLGALGLVIFLFWQSSRASVTVQAVEVSRKTISSIVSTNGIVQPAQEFQAHAAAPGVVKKLYVHTGDLVHAGEPLVSMDTSDAASRIAAAKATLETNQETLRNMQQGGTQDELLSQRSDLAAARKAVTQDQQALATRRQLLTSGAASPNEVQQAEQRLARDQDRLNQLQTRQSSRYSGGDLGAQRAQVDQARVALSAAENAYAASDIRAPFPGTVYGVSINPYDFVEGGALLLSVADLTKLQVRAYFDEPEVGKLAAGDPVTIEWAAKPVKLWHGHIFRAPASITTYGTRNVGEALITVDDADGDLLPNTNVTVHVVTQQHANVLTLPREALRTQGTNSYVFRIIDGTLVRTPISLAGALINVTQFEITGGLKEGDLIALHATTETDLADGMHVKVQR